MDDTVRNITIAAPSHADDSQAHKPAQEKPAAGARLQSIQILRAFAALFVLICHLAKEIRLEIGGTFLDWTNIELVGQSGVDIFFVISGFVMVYVTRNVAPTLLSSKEFILKRIIRLVPIYWILTFAMLTISLVKPDLKHHNYAELPYSIGSFLFIPFEREDGHFTPLLGVGWTLNYEMLFYALFSLVILTAPRRRLLAMVALFVGLSVIGLFMDRTAQPQVWFWTRPIILEFLAGGLVAHAFIRGVTMPPALCYVMVALGAVCLQLSGYLPDPTAYETRSWAWGGPAVMIVGGIVLARKSPFDWLPPRVAALAERAGDGSYSLYLVHMFVVRAVSVILGKLDLPGTLFTILCYVIVIPLALLVADFLYRNVELTFNQLGRKLLLREQT